MGFVSELVGTAGPHDFNVDTPIPNLSGRTIIVTGGNAGIGKQTVLVLSKHKPGKLYLTARSKDKYEAAMKDIRAINPSAKVEFLQMDLASLKSVKHAAQKVLDEEDRLDLLITNAGILGAPAALTDTGYEIHFGVNHMGHAAFIKMLMPLMSKTAKRTDVPKGTVRLVALTSGAAWNNLTPKVIDWEQQRTKRESLGEYERYAISKLANILNARSWAQRHPEVVCISVHPGRVGTSLIDGYLQSSKRWSLMGVVQRTLDATLGTLTVEQGALNTLWAATWPEGKGLSSGKIYVPVGNEVKGDAKCQSDELAASLWEWTETELTKHGIE